VSIPADLSRCPGCGLQLPELEAPTPGDVGASPACWGLYGRLLVGEYTQTPSPRLHRLTVDAYAAQHPRAEAASSFSALGVHLAGLCLLLERGASAEETTSWLGRLLERPPSIRSLERPVANGTVTVADVISARNPDERARLVERWATSVWDAWRPHHDAVQSWIDGIDRGTNGVHSES